MLLAEVVRVEEEGHAKGTSFKGVVSSRVRKDSMPFEDKRLGEELAVVAKPNNGDFEKAGISGWHLDVVIWVYPRCGGDGGGSGEEGSDAERQRCRLGRKKQMLRR